MAKEFLYHGKMIQDIKKMSLDEFAKLVPSRERRKLKRGFTEAEKKLLASVRANEKDIKRFLNKNVAPGSTIKSDGWKGYSTHALLGYTHDREVQSQPGLPKKYAPHIHKAFGNLKTWLLGTHHGVDPKHLQSYLDEYVFRFNRRDHPMAAFSTLLGIALKKEPLTMQNLVKP